MSQLEVAVEPILRKLWNDNYPLGRTTISGADTRTLTRWAIKTAWIREQNLQWDTAAGRQARLALSDANAVPPRTSVWVARHHGNLDFYANVARAQAAHQDDTFETARTLSLSLVLLVFHGLAIAVRTDEDAGIPWSPLNPLRWTQFWPSNESVVWPPPLTVSDEQVHLDARNVGLWLRMIPEADFTRTDTRWEQRSRN
jgi:hypothetical protein